MINLYLSSKDQVLDVTSSGNNLLIQKSSFNVLLIFGIVFDRFPKFLLWKIII